MVITAVSYRGGEIRTVWPGFCHGQNLYAYSEAILTFRIYTDPTEPHTLRSPLPLFPIKSNG